MFQDFKMNFVLGIAYLFYTYMPTFGLLLSLCFFIYVMFHIDFLHHLFRVLGKKKKKKKKKKEQSQRIFHVFSCVFY